MKILLPLLALFLTSCSPFSPDITTSVTPAQSGGVEPYQIWAVDTAFQLLGPDHKIVVEAVPDPQIDGIVCFWSRAKTGGITGGLGLAQDTSDASVACRQIGPITFREGIIDGQEIASARTSLIWKSQQIIRFYDESSNSLIYLVYSDRLIDGSPKNSISAVPLGEVKPLLK